MMQRDRRRQGLRVCRAAWFTEVSVREYREIEAGERWPGAGTWERMCEVFNWPQAFGTLGSKGSVGDRKAPVEGVG
jgi:hypothetical protein